MNFKEWLIKEMMGSVTALVGCKDLNNPNFQIQGAMSDKKCKNVIKIPKISYSKKKTKIPTL